MSQCNVCRTEMIGSRTCIEGVFIFLDRSGGHVKMRGIPHAGTGRCHDCDVLPRSYHHPGCAAEQCPRCGGQAIGCDCEMPDPEDLTDEDFEMKED